MEMTRYLDNDLSKMDDLSIKHIQKCLKSRYERDLIYTNISDILIAINPCKPLPIYDQTTHNEYRPANQGSDQPPHIFQVATAAYTRMWETDTNQVIIVSGESGAGKTESTKYMVKHLVEICHKGQPDLHNKIVEINPLLEAFGNAKTTMNENSSRYGKYLELSFKENEELCGAVVRDYMLEKSRVVHQNDNEGTFHFFYALFAGCPRDALADLYLDRSPSNYRILQKDYESLSLTDKYKRMYDECMSILQKLDVDREILHAMVAAVILIAEIDFYEDKRGAAQIKEESEAAFENAANLLNLDTIEFGEGLIASTMTVQGNTVAKQKTVSQARDGRDALAKMLYERMFGWLVRSINADLHPHRLGTAIHASIGILDIAGFEKLHTNSLEQLCINLVNEKLQNFMNVKIFKLEMEIYQQEGIRLDGIEFKNNDPLLEMFDKPRVGVWAILDENARLEHGSDQGFVEQLKKQYIDNPLFNLTRRDSPEFFITHFAANVLYDANGFVEKDRDRLNEELIAVMKKSSNEFISDLFTIRRGPTGTISMETNYHIRKSRRGPQGVQVMLEGKQKLKPTPRGAELAAELGKSLNRKFRHVSKPSATPVAKTSQQTVVSCFKASLGQLLEKLGDGDPFFVRCIKANASLQPNMFDDAVVEDQLTYNGLAEIAKIRKMGFDVRKDLQEFFSRYKFLFQSDQNPDRTQKILKRIPAYLHKDFRCGRTKIFMTGELNAWFEKALRCRRRAAANKIIYVIRKIGEIKAEQRRQEAIRKAEEEKRKAEEEKRRAEAKERVDEAAKLRSTGGLGKSVNFEGLGDSQASTSTDTRASVSSTDSEPEYVSKFRSSNIKDTFKRANLDDTYPRYRTDDNGDDLEDTNDREQQEANNERERKKMETAFWDVCQIITRERKIRDVDEDRGLQVVKVLTYFFIFCILFFCAVCQKISLVLLVKIPFNRTANRKVYERDDHALVAAARHILITIVILIPYCLIFLTSVFKWLFGSNPIPNVSTFIWCTLVEVLHSVGLCLLCFLILPELDMVLGIFLLNGVAIIPSILFPVCASDVKLSGQNNVSTIKHRIVVHALDVLVVLIQFGFIPYVLLMDYILDDSRLDRHVTYVVLFALSMIFISFSWWESFVDDRFCGKTKQRSFWKKAILKTKFDLQESRSVITTFTSFVKIGVTILVSYLTKVYLFENTIYEEKDIAGISVNQAFEKLSEMPLKQNASVLALALSAFVGYYVGYTACKLKLQRFSFDLPLILSTPVAVAIMLAECNGVNILSVFTDENKECLTEPSLIDALYKYIYGVLVWMSLYWLCRHIFYPNIERLAKTERLFMNPYYCGILFEQNFIMNRRRHTRRIYKELRDDDVTYRLSDYNSKVTIEGEEEEDRSDGSSKNEDVYSDSYRNPKFSSIPMIYACATMWHETKTEMIMLMKSIYRMDKDQYIRRTAEAVFGKEDKDFYDFEAHILFDDAMTMNDDQEMVPNNFVKTLVSIMDEAASCVYGKLMTLKPPFKVPTPYGGQLIYTLPGGNFLFVHMKDKAKIRHRKRWSQVMYMYYLLGFRIVRMCQETVTTALKSGKINALSDWAQDESGRVAKSQIFRAFDDQIVQKASNTFLLALDGDVDFSPGAVRLLLDRMRKSEKVGAACGRIHPVGTGPVVWFQKFEYAIAHWLQKATEHVLGCVLCSPGCFSLFRGSALMDDNIMKKYTILPSEAAHHLMYDQGEDRWLCTLLLQQGYRVDYAAGSDAFTNAPEGFAEFFNQRRRWMPSTVFNIIDLLSDYKNTVYVNTNISILYILYQGALLLSTIVGPATVLMMIATANTVVFRVSIIWGYVISLAPAVFFFTICFYVKAKVQVRVAEILTGLYAFVMMIVFVGTVVSAVQSSPFHPSVLFLSFLVITFSFAAMLHPKEWSNIVFGALYFLLIPTGFLLLNIYSLCNLHDVSWGTREVPKKLTKEEEEKAKQEEEEKKKKKRESGFFGRFFPQFQSKDLKEMFTKLVETTKQNQRDSLASSETNKLLGEMNDHLKELVAQRKGLDSTAAHSEPVSSVHIPEPDADQESKPTVAKRKGILKFSPTDHIFVDKADAEEERVGTKRDDLKNPAWAESKELGNGKMIPLAEEELKFWKGFVKKYLEPLQYSDEKKKNDRQALIGLRNNIALGLAMINLLWIAINFMFQFQSPTVIQLPLTATDDPDTPEYLEENQQDDDNETADNILKVDVLGLMFIFFYLAILLLQFVGMIIHRWGTLLHLVSVTKLKNPFAKLQTLRKQPERHPKDDTIEIREGRQIIAEMMEEPAPDYSDDSSEDDNEDKEVEEEIEILQKTGSRFRIQVNENNIGATSRTLNQSRWQGLGATHDIARSCRLIRNTIQAQQRPHITAPEGELLRQKVFHQKYENRPLPPINQRKGRKNFGPGRSELMERLSSANALPPDLRQSEEEHLRIREGNESDDSIYDVIGKKGTLSKHVGKQLKRYTNASKTLSNGRARQRVNFYEDSHQTRPKTFPGSELV